MVMVVRGRPFSFDPVLVLMERRGVVAEDLGRAAAAPSDGLSRSACRKRVDRWKVQGLTVDEADRVAVALGEHAWDVWGEAWWALPTVDLEPVFAPLRLRQRRLAARAAVAVRRRAVLVDEYTAVERTRERGLHRCAPDGCCGSRNAARIVEGVAA